MGKLWCVICQASLEHRTDGVLACQGACTSSVAYSLQNELRGAGALLSLMKVYAEAGRSGVMATLGTGATAPCEWIEASYNLLVERYGEQAARSMLGL